MGDPRTYHFTLPRYTGPVLAEPPNASYPGVAPHLPSVTSNRLVHGDGKIRAVVIHATDGSSSAGAMSVLFEHRASWHWLVPDEDEPEHGTAVWKCVPESLAAWHVRNDAVHPDVNRGSRYPNYWSVGIEVVNAQRADAFSNWQVRQTAAIVRYAWSRYPELVDVVSHAKLDPARRNDPGPAFPWETFREYVLRGPAPEEVAELSEATASPVGPIQILGPDGRRVFCDARLLDGVTMVEARPLVEALGFRVEYEPGATLTMRIRPGRRAPRSRSSQRKRGKRRPR